VKPEDLKPIEVDPLEVTLDSVEPPAAPAVVETRPDTAQWLIFGGSAAAIAGIVVLLAFPGARAGVPAEARPTAVAPAPLRPASPPPQIESTPPPTWTGARRTTWARDGSKTIAFSLAATQDLPVWMNHARPALVVRCLSRTTEAFVVLDTSTTYEQDADRRTVRVQWDDGPLNTQYWGVSESGRELFAPDGKEFVVRAAAAHTLRFGFTPFNASPVTAEFAVQGFDKMAELVASTCGWRLAPAS
jgi:hypothetical protein